MYEDPRNIHGTRKDSSYPCCNRDENNEITQRIRDVSLFESCSFACLKLVAITLNCTSHRTPSISFDTQRTVQVDKQLFSYMETIPSKTLGVRVVWIGLEYAYKNSSGRKEKAVRRVYYSLGQYVHRSSLLMSWYVEDVASLPNLIWAAM